MFKRTISIILALVLMLSLASVAIIPVSATDSTKEMVGKSVVETQAATFVLPETYATEAPVVVEPIITDPIEVTDANEKEELSVSLSITKSSNSYYTITANAFGGTGEYEYRFSINGTVYREYSSKNCILSALTYDGGYTFKVDVRDSAGTVVSTDTTLVVSVETEIATETVANTTVSIPIISPSTTNTTVPIIDSSSEPSTSFYIEIEYDTDPIIEYSVGDVTLDGKVNIRDATAIQKHLAKIKLLSDVALEVADFDQNEKLNIKDATNIQKFIAGIIGSDNHTHEYTEKVISPTCTQKGYTIYTCDCGKSYKDDWVNAKHIFSDKKCMGCGITAFDYYVSWIKENGTVLADHYRYVYKSVSELEGCENLNVYVCYYPTKADIREHITMDLYNVNYRDLTSISIFEEDNEAWYGYILSDEDAYAYGYIDIETYTLNTPISPYECESGTMTYLSFVEQTRESIKLTLISHLYGMETENAGVNLIDLGFFTENK